MKPLQLRPDDLDWTPNEHLHEMQSVVLAGNPDACEPYAVRTRLPAGCRLPPHSHPDDARMVTVLAGTLYFAFGDRLDESKLQAMPAGSFFVEPKDRPHYAMTKDEVVLQVHAIGPTGTKYVGARD